MAKTSLSSLKAARYVAARHVCSQPEKYGGGNNQRSNYIMRCSRERLTATLCNPVYLPRLFKISFAIFVGSAAA